ncbi:MAG: N-acetyltransferase [Thermoguttaceae bacterium]|nr:N-acetyltransferase [Thermoguttaceae bacterium]
MQNLTTNRDASAFRKAAIRPATRADAPELQAIYAHYVEKTTVSFECEAPDVAETERRIAAVDGVYPFLVCVVEEDERGNSEDASSLPIRTAGNKEKRAKNERIVGYALAHRAFERAAYAWTAETTVYVDRNWRRRGVGEALYSALIEILERQGVRVLYAVVVAENKASVEFHRRAGYREFATFKNSGWKFGRWLDVVWLERTLGVWRDVENAKSAEIAPTPIRPIVELDAAWLANVCDAAARNVRVAPLD